MIWLSGSAVYIGWSNESVQKVRKSHQDIRCLAGVEYLFIILKTTLHKKDVAHHICGCWGYNDIKIQLMTLEYN